MNICLHQSFKINPLFTIPYTRSVASVVVFQGAVAALADARRDVARAGSTRYRRRAADKDRHDRRCVDRHTSY